MVRTPPTANKVPAMNCQFFSAHSCTGFSMSDFSFACVGWDCAAALAELSGVSWAFWAQKRASSAVTCGTGVYALTFLFAGLGLVTAFCPTKNAPHMAHPAARSSRKTTNGRPFFMSIAAGKATMIAPQKKPKHKSFAVMVTPKGWLITKNSLDIRIMYPRIAFHIKAQNLRFVNRLLPIKSCYSANRQTLRYG